MVQAICHEKVLPSPGSRRRYMRTKYVATATIELRLSPLAVVSLNIAMPSILNITYWPVLE
jgi:hypothetical protein